MKLLFALLTLLIASATQVSAQQRPQSVDIVRDSVTLVLGYVTEPYVVDPTRPFRTVRIGDEKVVDIATSGEQRTIRDDRTVDLIPVGVGATNILFFGSQGEIIKNLEVVVVKDFVERTKLHNKKFLGSYTAYRCSSTGCQITGEKTVEEQNLDAQVRAAQGAITINRR